MSKRMKALLIMIMSLLAIFISFVIVTMNGVANGQIRSYEIFYIYNVNNIDNELIINLIAGIFFVGFFVFLMPNPYLFTKKKLKFISNTSINVLGFIIVCFFCRQQRYIFMMAVVCACIAINIIFLSTNGIKKQIDILVIVITLIVTALNLLILCEHAIISMHWKLCGLNDVIFNRIKNSSIINVIFFALFFLPCIMMLHQERKINKIYRRI